MNGQTVTDKVHIIITNVIHLLEIRCTMNLAGGVIELHMQHHTSATRFQLGSTIQTECLADALGNTGSHRMFKLNLVQVVLDRLHVEDLFLASFLIPV